MVRWLIRIAPKLSEAGVPIGGDGSPSWTRTTIFAFKVRYPAVRLSVTYLIEITRYFLMVFQLCSERNANFSKSRFVLLARHARPTLTNASRARPASAIST